MGQLSLPYLFNLGRATVGPDIIILYAVLLHLYLLSFHLM